MTEKQATIAQGENHTAQDWPTLVGRAADDLTHILQSEAHMLETSLSMVLANGLAGIIATLTVISVIIVGGICVLCAAILLVHEWLPLWQAFGIAGIGTLLIGVAVYAIMNPRVGTK